MIEILMIYGIVFLIILIPIVYSECSVTFDRQPPTNYTATEIISADMVCTVGSEKSIAYKLNWTNVTGTTAIQLEVDTGITPESTDEHFFQSYTIPSDFTGIINASLIGTDLEGNDTAYVGGATSNALILSNVMMAGPWLGQSTSFKADVKDENAKKISGGVCVVEVYSNDQTEIYESITGLRVIDGELRAVWISTPSKFREDTGYVVEGHCFCGTNLTDQQCIDEDGNTVINSVGTVSTSFTTNNWITLTTSVLLSNIAPRQKNTISVNVTNNRDINVPLNIIYDCVLNESDSSKKRIKTPFYFPECDNHGTCEVLRGISANFTQEQSTDFIVEEHPYIQGKTTAAYCKVYIYIKDIVEGIVYYSKLSPSFNITSTDLNLVPDWALVDDLTLNSIINLSEDEFCYYNGTGTGNIDLRIFTSGADFDVTHAQLDFRTPLEIINAISNITVKNLTHTLTEHTDYELEWQEDNNLELELRNVPLDKNSDNWWNITIEFYDFEKRQTEALEGINSSAGTFDFGISVPNTDSSTVTVAGSGLTGDGRTLNRDINIKCQVIGYPETLTEFNVYVTDKFAFAKTVSVPDIPGYFTMSCTAIDRFFGEDAVRATDNFVRNVLSESGAGGVQLSRIEEETKEAVEETPLNVPKKDWSMLLLIVIVMGFIAKKISNDKEDKPKDAYARMVPKETRTYTEHIKDDAAIQLNQFKWKNQMK